MMIHNTIFEINSQATMAKPQSMELGVPHLIIPWSTSQFQISPRNLYINYSFLNIFSVANDTCDYKFF
jgi:hypothetical protein